MTTSKTRRAKIAAYTNEQNTYSPACKTLRHARTLLGISQWRLARRIGVPENVWLKYENGALRIPESLMLKIFMFGLDFWCERDI